MIILNKFKLFTISAILSITSLGLFPTEKADAADFNATALDESVLGESVLNESALDELISVKSVSGSGWQTKGGITARVSTSKDAYAANESFVVNAERSGSGATVYYEIMITKQIGSSWNVVPDSGKKGTFTNKVHKISFNNYGKGIYKATLKVWSDSSYQYWIGDWETTFAAN